ncbi:hypothetical protein L7F22_046497 [Adiantum nelumboides]|nr:hypothetical protein [Adiantum nelumboides]
MPTIWSMTLPGQVLRRVLRSTRFCQRYLSRVPRTLSITRTACTDPPHFPIHAPIWAVKTRSLIILVHNPCNIFCQNGIRDMRRAFTTPALEKCESQLDDPPCNAKQLKLLRLDSYTQIGQAATETMGIAEENIIFGPQGLAAHDVDSNTTSEDDVFSGKTGLEAHDLDSRTTSEDDVFPGKIDAEKDFYNLIEAEDSPEELLSMLLHLEEALPLSDDRVCHTCLRLAVLCNDNNDKPEKVLDYARQAFHNFDSSRFPIESVKALFLVAMGHYKMGDLKEALPASEKCASQMAKLKLPSTKTEELAILQFKSQILSGQVKVSLGWNLEGLLEFKKGLAVIEKFFLSESPLLAFCYQEMALAYVQANEPKEALGLCGKSLLVFSKCFGYCSLQVADVRSLMSQIYNELDDHESVLCQCQLAVQIFKKLGETDKAVSLNLESMQAHFLLGKFNEAVTILNEIIKMTQQEDQRHVEALILLVSAFIGLKNSTAAAEYSQRALNSLENKELNFDLAKTLMRLSIGFQQLQNYDQALVISQRAQDFFEKCVKEEAALYAADAQCYRGSLFLSAGKPNEAIPHLEKALEVKKSICGSKQGELLDVCNHLGAAYAHAKRIDEALAVFRQAKMMISSINNGADLISIYIYNNLSLTCILSGR